MNLQINTSLRCSPTSSAASTPVTTPTKRNRLMFFKSSKPESAVLQTSIPPMAFSSLPYNDADPTEPCARLESRSRSSSMPNFMVFRTASTKLKTRKQSVPSQFISGQSSSSSSFSSTFSSDAADSASAVASNHTGNVTVDDVSVSPTSSISGSTDSYQDCIIPPPPISQIVSKPRGSSIHSIIEETIEFPSLETPHEKAQEQELEHEEESRDSDELAHSILSNVYRKEDVNWVV